ncbi:MAG: hypothetical protein IJT53_05885 [Prevotella sp.]|nr:hypothetical protein [Prevotella sp.]
MAAFVLILQMIALPLLCNPDFLRQLSGSVHYLYQRGKEKDRHDGRPIEYNPV